MASMSHERLKADNETTALLKDLKRISELRDFLELSKNAGNRKRVQQLEEEQRRINKRLEELERVT